MTRRARWCRRLTWLLVGLVAVLAFARSFEAIADYARQLGWGDVMCYVAPLLVDTFTVAAMLVILVRAWEHVRAVYAWVLLVGASVVSVALNVAHADPNPEAQVFAALPPVALLAAVELAMSEARRDRGLTMTQAAAEAATLAAEATIWAGRAQALAARAATVALPEPVGPERSTSRPHAAPGPTVPRPGHSARPATRSGPVGSKPGAGLTDDQQARVAAMWQAGHRSVRAMAREVGRDTGSGRAQVARLVEELQAVPVGGPAQNGERP